MKQISTGTGLVVLSGTVLASVFLSSPRTATTAFASAQQTQPAERSVTGNRGSNAAMVADCQSTESLPWFSSTPKEIQGCKIICNRGIMDGDMDMSFENDINNDGNLEYLMYSNAGAVDPAIFISAMETVNGVATSKLVLVCSVDSQSINGFRSSIGLPLVEGWRMQGLRDCDNDGDLDIVIASGWGGDTSYMYFENTGFQHAAPLEGDLNHDGHVDNTDVGLVLLNFDA